MRFMEVVVIETYFQTYVQNKEMGWESGAYG